MKTTEGLIMKTLSFNSKAAYYNYLDNNESDYIYDCGYDSGWYITIIENGLIS